MDEPSTPEATIEDAANALAATIHLSTSRGAAPTPARDLTFGQIRLLFLLLRDGPQSMGRVGEVFDLTPTAATGFVQRVERHGLVERHHRSADRRVVECALTPDGRTFVDQLSGLRLDAIRRTLSVLDGEEIAELVRLLRLVIARSTAVEP